MASLMTLPPEIRHEIWSYLGSSRDQMLMDHDRSSSTQNITPLRTLNSLVRTCKRFSTEVAPFLYQSVYLELVHPNQALRWLASIGPLNSSCVQYLALKTKLLGLRACKDTDANEAAWALAMRSMPNMQTLIFHLERDPHINPAGGPSTDSFATDSQILEPLAASALACSTITSRCERNTRRVPSIYSPNPRSHPYTQAFFSIDEPLPPPLVQQFNQVITLPKAPSSTPSQHSTGLDNESIETSITGLTPAFYKGNRFALTSTYVFSEKADDTSAFLVFSRPASQSTGSTEVLQNMMRDLPNLDYLRIGCQHIDSAILTHVPKHVRTLDVAFTDDEPERVAENLMTMRGICKKLFMLAIAVSPLHDRDLVDEDPWQEVFFNRNSVTVQVAERWTPFWKALDEIRASKVTTWEGEGPGFRRGRTL